MMLREGGSGVRCGYDVMMSSMCLDDTSAMSCDVVKLVGMPHSAEHEKKGGWMLYVRFLCSASMGTGEGACVGPVIVCGTGGSRI